MCADDAPTGDAESGSVKPYVDKSMHQMMNGMGGMMWGMGLLWLLVIVLLVLAVAALVKYLFFRN